MKVWFTRFFDRIRGLFQMLYMLSWAVERERHENGMCNCCGSRYMKEGGNSSLYSTTQGRNSASLCPQCAWTRRTSTCFICKAGPERWCSEEGNGTETPLFLHTGRVLSHVDAMYDAWKKRALERLP